MKQLPQDMQVSFNWKVRLFHVGGRIALIKASALRAKPLFENDMRVKVGCEFIHPRTGVKTILSVKQLPVELENTEATMVEPAYEFNAQ